MREITFKYDIGNIIKDEKRDLVIIKQEIRVNKSNKKYKYYQYKCNKCGYDEGWIEEHNLQVGKGCPCCSNPIRLTKLGINTIYDTTKWMIPYVGMDIAKTHTRMSNKKIHPICPYCGKQKKKSMMISTICSTHSIGCTCGDGTSIPNKIMFNLLEQLNVDFKTEYSPTWIKPRRYDFYVPSMNLIIEMDGRLGHGNDGYSDSVSKEDLYNIDLIKDEKANKNGLKVIRIDCRYLSTDNKIEYIKHKINNSELNLIFNLDNINWIEIEKFAYSNFVKVACDYKKNNPTLTTAQIGNIMGYTQSTIVRWLHIGNKLGWCEYNPKQEQRKAVAKNGKANGKEVSVYKDGEYIKTYCSVAEASRRSKEDLGIYVYEANIAKVCRGLRKTTGGYTFVYVNQENQEKQEEGR